jgi:hypothetical protein
MDMLRNCALALCSGILLTGLLLPLAPAPALAAPGAKTLHEQRQELTGISRIMALRHGTDPTELTASPIDTAAFAAVPLDHWAYPAISHLAENGLLEGYPDSFFKGDRPLSRYDFFQAMASLTPIPADDSEAQLAVSALRLEFGDQLSAVQEQFNALNAQLAELQQRLDSVRDSQE